MSDFAAPSNSFSPLLVQNAPKNFHSICLTSFVGNGDAGNRSEQIK